MCERWPHSLPSLEREKGPGLTRTSSCGQSWRHRWFVLKPAERTLLYYKKQDEPDLGRVRPPPHTASFLNRFRSLF
jgi:hypothetical protein